MKDKKQKDPIKSSKRFIKILAYLMFFFFGIRLIIIPFVWRMSGGIVINTISAVINMAIIIFGLFAAYKLLKLKKWALIAVVVLVAMNIASSFIMTAAMGRVKIPAAQIAILITLIMGFKHLKVLNGDKK